MRFPRCLGLLVIVPLALLSACNRGSRPPQLDIPAPQFSVTDGTTSVRLANYRGKVVLVNFWWSQCAPCLEELPSLLELHRQMPDLVILAISIDEDPGSYTAFIARHHVDLITVRDPDQSVPKLFHTDMWPETYIIDRNGIIRSKIVGGQQDWTSPGMESFLKSL